MAYNRIIHNGDKSLALGGIHKKMAILRRLFTLKVKLFLGSPYLARNPASMRAPNSQPFLRSARLKFWRFRENLRNLAKQRRILLHELINTVPVQYLYGHKHGTCTAPAWAQNTTIRANKRATCTGTVPVLYKHKTRCFVPVRNAFTIYHYSFITARR